MAFPKTLYVKIEKADGDSYFVADRSTISIAEMGEKIVMARYELAQTFNAECVVKTGPIQKKHRGRR